MSGPAPFLTPSLLLLLLLHHTASLARSGPHIADVNILLPPKMTHPVEYRLQGSDGCFKWSWDHHDILSVLPEFNSSSHCSTSARLKSIAPYGGRQETAVYATDLNTGTVIRCKVYIDMISRIQIFHNSIKLDLDGLATLRVRAFDSEENVFSSLVGLQFMWQLMPESHGLPDNLVHVPLKDSPLSDCGGLCGDLDIQVKLEESGVYSDLFVVKGIEIGRDIISVNLLESSVEHLADKIVLTVAEAMSLDPPSPVYVLIGAVIHYTLKVIRSNSLHTVNLPSPFHKWSILNSSVAQVESALGTVHALNLGITTVVVEDTRVGGHMQISFLHVVLPDNLVLYMSPLSLSGGQIDDVEPIPSVSRWYVVSGRLYLILVKVFSPGPGTHEIFITGSDEIELHYNGDEFCTILPVSEGGEAIAKKNYRILKANSYGLGILAATLSYSTGHDMRKEVVKVVQEVMVCDPVQFNMERDRNVSDRIFLPWVPGVYQELELKVSGGCAMSLSDYKWFSSDMAVLSVSVSGVVLAKKPGKATVRVVSIFDSLNFDELVIEVTIPRSMFMLPNFPVETPVGSYLQVSLTLKASNGFYYYACDAFKFAIRWSTESDSFVVVNATEELLVSDKKEPTHLRSLSFGLPCAWTYIYCTNPGRSVVRATLVRENEQSDQTGLESVALQASLSIAAFSPLIVHQASDGNRFGGYWFDLAHAEEYHNQLENLDLLYLVPGTQLDVLLRGGPERWGKDVEFIEHVQVLNEQTSSVKNTVFIDQLSTRFGNSYKIGCEGLGTFRLVFRRGNLIGEDHPLPVVSEVQLLLACSFPSSIVILADEALNALPAIKSAAQAERLPEGIRVPSITVANGRKIRVSAVGLSDSGKAFANSSSLRLSWELTQCERLALLEEPHGPTTYSSWEKFLILQNTSGLCVVRTTVVGFIDSLRHLNFTKMIRLPTLADAIQLQLVSSLRVSQEFGLLFFDPEARLNISITGGSCFVETLVNNTQIVEVVQRKHAHECSHLVLVPKSLGYARIMVHDIGLVPPLAAFSIVRVAEMDWIKISVGECLSIMEGTSQSLSFLVGVGDGQVFDPSQYSYMNIRVHVEESIVEVDKYVHASNFTLQAIRLGVTTLYLSAIQHSGHEIRSQQVIVEVYSPPKIRPSDIFLVPGASYVLTVSGGPRIGSHVQYTSADDQAAKIHMFSGLLSAISPGNSTLTATIYGDDDIELCQAYALVKVGVPTSAVLNVQSEHLAIGRTMPIYPSLSEGNVFSFYELCSNFEWAVEDKDVLSFQSRDEVQSVDFLNGQDFNFIQVVGGLSAGKTIVTVSFSCNYKFSNLISKSISYNASVLLSVVSDLPLNLGLPITWILPSYYTSSDLLPSSSHSLGDKGIAYSLLGRCKRKTEEVRDNNNIYLDGAKIITKESGNLACIQAKDRSTGRTEVASCVRVADAAQIRIVTDEFPIHALAVGSELDLPVKYHDNLGNPFHEAHNLTLFDVETNNAHILSFDEYDGGGKIHVRAKSQGTALVQIAFVSNPRKSVYAIISIGPQLYPQNPVIQEMSTVNFEIKGLTDLASGHWYSANESVVSIEKLSGKAEAVGEGTTHVHFLSPSSKLHTVVTVQKENKVVSVNAPSELVLTNVPFPVKGYAFAVQFKEARGTPYDCVLDPPNIGFAKAWKDPDTGNLYCLFFPYSLEQLAHSSLDSINQVPVTIRVSVKWDDRVSGSASALFVRGFNILEMVENSLCLNLTRDSNTGVLTVIGNTDVELNWQYRNRISVKSVNGEDRVVGKYVKYEVKVLGAEKLRDWLIFSLPATGQRVDVEVSYEAEERKSISGLGNATPWLGIFCLLLLLMFVMVFVISYLCRPERSVVRSHRVVSGSPGVAAPVTPERGSSTVISDQSPRSPPQFINYVRRTIDETPYYRQDFRRRSNPQNTF